MTAENVLTVDFCDERRTVLPGDTLTFGRAGDLAIDEANPYLHRVVGRFLCHNARVVAGEPGRPRRTRAGDRGRGAHPPAAPPARRPLGPGDGDRPAVPGDVRGGGPPLPARRWPGRARRWRPPRPRGRPACGPRPSAGCGSPTRSGRWCWRWPSRASATRRAGPRRCPPTGRSPTGSGGRSPSSTASSTTCASASRRTACPGLQGGRGAEATNRRWRLVEHAVNARLVTPGDLRAPGAY